MPPPDTLPPDSPPVAASPKVISVREIEALVRRLRGVLACRVVTGAGGGVDEIHALAHAERPAKMVVRDIESALRAQWNLQIPRNRVSVAQVDPAGAENALRAQASRPRLRLIGAAVDESPLTARVTLGRADGTETIGTAAMDDVFSDDGAAAQSGPPRAVLLARATLRAAEGTGAGVNGRLQLVSLTLVPLGNQVAIILLVRLQSASGKNDDLLTGSALVRGDGDRAVVAATLDAVNRRLSSLEPQQSVPPVPRRAAGDGE